MASESPELDILLSTAPKYLPLDRPALETRPNICKLRSQDAAIFFTRARHPQAAFAGLLFRLGCWEESHSIAQDVASAEGSYWHAMLHRIEPDASNARYWFRRVGEHPIFPKLLRSAKDRLQDGALKDWKLKSTWDPFLFIEWCEVARASGGQAETVAVAIQMAEWELLFNWCADKLDDPAT